MTAKDISAQDFLQVELKELASNPDLQKQLQTAALAIASQTMLDHTKYKRELMSTPDKVNTVINYMGNLTARSDTLQNPDQLPVYEDLPIRARYILREYEQRLLSERLQKAAVSRSYYDQSFVATQHMHQTTNVVTPPPQTEWMSTLPDDQIETIDVSQLGTHRMIQSAAFPAAINVAAAKPFKPRPVHVEPVTDVDPVTAAVARSIRRTIDAIPDAPPARAYVSPTIVAAAPTPQRWALPELARRTQLIETAMTERSGKDLAEFVEQILKVEQKVTMAELTARRQAGTLRNHDTQFVFDYADYLKRQLKAAEVRLAPPAPVATAPRWSYEDLSSRMDKIEDALKVKTGDNLFVFTRDILMTEYKATKDELLIRVAAGTDKTPEGNAIADYGVSLLNAITHAKARLEPDATRVEAFKARLQAHEDAQRTPSIFQTAVAGITSFAKGLFQKKEPALAVPKVDPLPAYARSHLEAASITVREELAQKIPTAAPASRWSALRETASAFGKVVSATASKAVNGFGEAVTGSVDWVGKRVAPVALGVTIAAGAGVLATKADSPDVTSLARNVVAQQKADQAPSRIATGLVVQHVAAASSVAPAPVLVAKADTPEPAPVAKVAPVSLAKSTFSAAAKTVEAFKPATSISYTFNDGTASRFDAETIKKACDQLRGTGTTSTICDEPGLKNG